jgi:apolipoprotein N-acyltransferase
MRDEGEAALPDAASASMTAPPAAAPDSGAHTQTPFLLRPAALLLSAGFGAVSVAGFAPLAWFPLPIVTLAALALVWRGVAEQATSRRARAAAWHGFAFGLGLFVSGVSWVFVSLADFGGMPAPLAATATLLFCAILALYPAAVGYLQQRIGGAFAMRALLLIPALWTIGEWLRGTVTGFPWLAWGYAHSPPSPLAGFAPVAGVFGVTLAAALTAGALAALAGVIADRSLGTLRLARAVPPVLVVAALLACGFALRQAAWTEAAGKPLKVALLQGNIAQNLKFDEDWYEKTLAGYRALALATDARLIIWPETAIPRLLSRVDPEYLEDLNARAAARGADMLIGIPYRDEARNYYNSVFSFGASPAQTYSKTHLVPFGEFIPAGFDWILAILHIPLGDFARGPANPSTLAVAGQQVALNICYEDAFGEEIIRQLPQATLLVNVSNIAWFGRSIAPAQHLQIAQMRALETGRAMLRATNTGMTAAINAQGLVEQVLPQFKSAVLEAMVEPRAGATPFVRWGNAPALIVAFTLFGIAVLAARRRKL